MSADDALNRVAVAAPLPDVAERVRLRQELGIQQLEVAREVGVSTQTVWAWETGRSQPTGVRRRRYAALLAAMRRRLNEGGTVDV